VPPTLPSTAHIKGAIRRDVIRLFNDVEHGEVPVPRSNDAMFSPRSVIWRVHGDVGSMMVGGIASLLMQMLHPAVLAGVWDHSNFRTDMHGRLRRTARFIATTTYGHREDAASAIRRVIAIHQHVTGVLPDGRRYRANDPELLAWVHVTEASNFLAAWVRYGEPFMSQSDRDRYFMEMAGIGEAMGAEPVPRSATEAQAIIAALRPKLAVDDRTHEVAKLILGRSATSLADLPNNLATQAAVDLLPSWARQLHGFPASPLRRPLLRAGTFGLAQTLRWAFR
jgi:uncharacterized protein (DUF2236 family)